MVKKDLIDELIELQRRVDRDPAPYELDSWMRLNLGIAQLKSIFSSAIAARPVSAN